MPIRVNNNTVSDEEIAAEEARITQHLATHVPPEQLEAMKEVMKKQAAESLINRVLLKEAVETEDIGASDEELDERMEMVKSKFESPEAYSQQLADLGITQKGLRSEMETSLRMEKLLQSRTRKSRPGVSRQPSFWVKSRRAPTSAAWHRNTRPAPARKGAATWGTSKEAGWSNLLKMPLSR